MGIVYCGIDEAGYGPMLGPMCVGRAVFRISGHDHESPVPDVWSLLSPAVCRTLKELRAGGRHRIAIADSKKIKLSNQSVTRHPLLHLERGVLAMLRACGVRPESDAELVAALGTRFPHEDWYAGEAVALPIASTTDDLGIAGNLLATACGKAGVILEDLGCEVIGEAEFNACVRSHGSKAAVTAFAVRHHLQAIRDRFADGADAVRIVCDRLGGRSSYGDLLRASLPGCTVLPLSESPEKSVYEVRGWAMPARVLFMTESESAHLPVALASMTAKLIRELAMLRLNRHFTRTRPDLKPTAGYVADARRWLDDVRGSIDTQTRRRLVRVV